MYMIICDSVAILAQVLPAVPWLCPPATPKWIGIADHHHHHYCCLNAALFFKCVTGTIVGGLFRLCKHQALRTVRTGVVSRVTQ